MDVLIGYEYSSFKKFEDNTVSNNFKNAYQSFLKMKNDINTIVIDGNNYNLSKTKTIIKNINPYKITHLRINGKIFYKTIFHGKDINVVVDGSISSGYGGQGPTEFMSIIKTLGINEDEMEKYIHGTHRGEDEECQMFTVVLIDNIE